MPARFEVNGEPTNKTVTSGHQDLVLRCRAEGVPTPTVSWKRIDGNLPDGSQVLDSGDLKIIRVMEEDQGGYRCVVKNKIGGAKESQIAFVKVSGEFVFCVNVFILAASYLEIYRAFIN